MSTVDHYSGPQWTMGGTVFDRIKYNLHLVNPFEIAIAVSFFILGLAILVVPPLIYPTSIAALFPGEALRLVWGLCVTFSGAIKTAGLLIGNTNWRRAGLILLMGVSAVFVMAIITAGNVAFFFTGGIFAAICLASLAMYRRLR